MCECERKKGETRRDNDDDDLDVTICRGRGREGFWRCLKETHPSVSDKNERQNRLQDRNEGKAETSTWETLVSVVSSFSS